ncbi:MAG: AAA family ATPase [Deltaproteobacteria bacterium]|nr:AAA family ATPase [Deltaproteobacteria bacterium]
MTDSVTFYGFSENPFAAAPDPRFFFPSESHKEALASLFYGINERKGFVLLLGEAGVGKTTLIHHLIGTLDSNVRTLFFPQCPAAFEPMLQEMLLGLKLPPGPKNKGSMMHALYYELIRCRERDENVAIIIDEAEKIGLDLIEEVRLLANLETSTSKLLQIVLAGEPELRKKLRSDVIRQIKQRIVIVCEIKRLTEEESLQYIDHRLEIVGSGSADVFTEEALSLICRQARGVPLALNTLCSNALSLGCRLGEKKISPSTVKKIRGKKKILDDREIGILASGFRRFLPRTAAAIALTFALLAAALFFGWSHLQPLFEAPGPDRPVIPPAVKDTVKASPREVKPPVARQATGESARPSPVEARPAAMPPPAKEGVQAPPAAVKPPDVGERVPVIPGPKATERPQVAAPPPAAAARSDTEIRVKEVVEVQKGANLYALAYRYLKGADETAIDHIMQLNPGITNPHLIRVNQKIKIPEITDSLRIVPHSDGGYRVHLKTFASLRSATQYRQSVTLKGKQIEVVPWKVSPQETWYRVMAGPFRDRAEGSKAIADLNLR